MTNLELVLNMLAEVSTTEISKEKKPKSLDKNIEVACKGGNAAKKARLEIEKQTGKSIISSKIVLKSFMASSEKMILSLDLRWVRLVIL